MHNNLLKRHEKEVQLNVQHMETVTSLTVSTLSALQLMAHVICCDSMHFCTAPHKSVMSVDHLFAGLP